MTPRKHDANWLLERCTDLRWAITDAIDATAGNEEFDRKFDQVWADLEEAVRCLDHAEQHLRAQRQKEEG